MDERAVRDLARGYKEAWWAIDPWRSNLIAYCVCTTLRNSRFHRADLPEARSSIPLGGDQVARGIDVWWQALRASAAMRREIGILVRSRSGVGDT